MGFRPVHNPLDCKILATPLPMLLIMTGGSKRWRACAILGNTAATDVMRRVLAPLGDINATQLVDGGASSDTGEWVNIGVPGAELYSANEDYFFYHHSHGKTITSSCAERRQGTKYYLVHTATVRRTNIRGRCTCTLRKIC